MLSRRKFIENTFTLGSALPLLSAFSPRLLYGQPYQEQPEGPGFLPKIGLQLYTVREQMQQDPAATLKAIADIGYKQVEGGDLLNYPKLLPLLQNSGLRMQSMFIPSAILTGRWDLEGGRSLPDDYTQDLLIEDAMNYDFKYLVFGYLHREERQSLDDYKRIIEKLNAFGEKCNQADINLCYHNHSFEFEPIAGKVPFELMIQDFGADMVNFELDVFWASIGGQNPVELLEKLAGRVRLMHLKDKRKGTSTTYDEGKVKPKTFMPIGKGSLDIPAILKTAEQTGVEQCFIEQDQSPDPLESIRQSYQYLESLED